MLYCILLTLSELTEQTLLWLDLQTSGPSKVSYRARHLQVLRTRNLQLVSVSLDFVMELAADLPNSIGSRTLCLIPIQYAYNSLLTGPVGFATAALSHTNRQLRCRTHHARVYF